LILKVTAFGVVPNLKFSALFTADLLDICTFTWLRKEDRTKIEPAFQLFLIHIVGILAAIRRLEAQSKFRWLSTGRQQNC